MGTLTRALILALALSAVGCQKLTESIIQAGLDEIFEEWESDIDGAFSSPPASSQPTSLAFFAGTESRNVECFVIGSGRWDSIYVYADGDKPIGIAITDDANIMITSESGLQRGGQRIVTRDDLQRETGATEFGLVAAVPGAPASEVVVAATTPDDDTVLVRIDANDGTILGATAPQAGTEVAGLTVVGNMAIVAEAPFGDIVCYDLSEPTPSGVVLVSGSDMLGQPAGMTVGPNGTLFVASSDQPVVQEFDLDSGVELDRFRIESPGLDGLRDIEFDPHTESFVVTAGTDAVYMLDDRGNLRGVHVGPRLAGATSITIQQQ